MRPLSLLLQCCCLAGSAYAQAGYLYTFANLGTSSPAPLTSTSSETAYTILCRRQGITEERHVHGVEEEELLQINQFGGFHPALFSEDEAKEPSRVLVRILGYEHDRSSSMAVQPDLAISKPSRDLLKDLTIDNDHNARICKYEVATKESAKAEFKLKSKGPCSPQQDVFHWPRSEHKSLSDIVSWVADKLMRGGSARLVDVQIDFTPSRLSNTQISNNLALLLPTLMTLSSFASMQPTMLTLPSPARLARSTSHLELRQDPEEELLDLPTPSSSYTQIFASNVSANYTLPSNLPACFSSVSSCENATNHCSGHGTCKNSTRAENCYKCQCTRTSHYSKSNPGNRTDAWAGAACQKKDISFEFTLFASFGVVMTALVAGGIGMLWSMGSQELPSVIGAGVAGPQAQK